MKVVVAGGGIAALEVLAGLHALARDRVDMTLLAPDRSFSYRPLSTAVPFTSLGERTRGLKELAEGLGAQCVHDGLAQVDERRGRVLTHDGDFLHYDALVLAVGARQHHTAPGEVWRRNAEGIAALSRLLRRLEDGRARRVAFVVPRGTAWPIDAYELALIAGLAAGRSRAPAQLSLLTAEDEPLHVLGAAAGEAVGAELKRAGIELVTGVQVSAPRAEQEGGRDAFSSVMARLTRRQQSGEDKQTVIKLEPGAAIAFDDVLSLPAVLGPHVAGAPHEDHGFLAVDDHGRVPHTQGVYAAGDSTALSLKHSTLASAQGTAVAEAIAAASGADVDPQPWSSVLHGFLTLPPRFPGAPGSPWLADGDPATHCLWWPPGHVAGRHLAPYLASSDRGIKPGLAWHPRGLPIAIDVHGPSNGGPSPPPVTEAAMRQDAISRQLLAVRRAEREGVRLEHSLERLGEEFERHERHVIQQLRAAGYLHAE